MPCILVRRAMIVDERRQCRVEYWYCTCYFTFLSFISNINHRYHTEPPRPHSPTHDDPPSPQHRPPPRRHTVPVINYKQNTRIFPPNCMIIPQYQPDINIRKTKPNQTKSNQHNRRKKHTSNIIRRPPLSPLPPQHITRSHKQYYWLTQPIQSNPIQSNLILARLIESIHPYHRVRQLR